MLPFTDHRIRIWVRDPIVWDKNGLEVVLEDELQNSYGDEEEQDNGDVDQESLDLEFADAWGALGSEQ